MGEVHAREQSQPRMHPAVNSQHENCRTRRRGVRGLERRRPWGGVWGKLFPAAFQGSIATQRPCAWGRSRNPRVGKKPASFSLSSSTPDSFLLSSFPSSPLPSSPSPLLHLLLSLPPSALFLANLDLFRK